jgi:hypothetical protein
MQPLIPYVRRRIHMRRRRRRRIQLHCLVADAVIIPTHG